MINKTVVVFRDKRISQKKFKSWLFCFVFLVIYFKNSSLKKKTQSIKYKKLSETIYMNLPSFKLICQKIREVQQSTLHGGHLGINKSLKNPQKEDILF